MTATLKNILFDLGGVIVDIRRQDCIDAFQKLGFTDIADYLGDYGQSGFFLGIEDGSLTPEEFRAQLRRHIPGEVSDAQLDDAFNAFITGIPLQRLQALRRLRAEGWKLYVVSNTNPIMWDQSLRREFEKEGNTREDYFDGIVTSFEAKCCKPGRAIFDKVTADFGINPAETIFFDDSQANCSIGASLGFQAIHVPPGLEFIDLMPGRNQPPSCAGCC